MNILKNLADFLFIQLKTPQGGSTAAPLFILGDFAEAFVGERSPFEEVAMRKAILLEVHTAGSRRVLGEFLASSWKVFGTFSAEAWQFL